MQQEVDKGEVRALPVMVMAIPRYLTFSKTKTRFRMRKTCSTFALTFGFCFDFGFGSLHSFYYFIDIVFELRPAAGHVMSLQRGPPDGPSSRRHPRPCNSSPCSRCTSDTLATDVATECTVPSIAAAPICAFNPKYYCLPFSVWCIARSRSLFAFLVREDVDNGRSDDRSCRDTDALRHQMQVHRVQHRPHRSCFTSRWRKRSTVSSGAGATPRSTLANRRSVAHSQMPPPHGDPIG